MRLADNPALVAACASYDRLLLIALISPDETRSSVWGFPRWGAHRRAFRAQALEGLAAAIAACGGALHVLDGEAATVIPILALKVGAAQVFCESIAAPEEISEVAQLRAAGLQVSESWQSSLLDPAKLPFGVDKLPEVFTAFRQAVERAHVSIDTPAPTVTKLPPCPEGMLSSSFTASVVSAPTGIASFPFDQPAFHGSEQAAIVHIERYFGSLSPQSYKTSRNGLMGIGYSTKLSPWLAIGAVSPRTVYRYLQKHEAQAGANESTYWIWFELLWRDFFRFWSMKHGIRLFSARGLGRAPPAHHDQWAFQHWCKGKTQHPFINAGMRELAATGYLSNRMRQVVASYLIHDLHCDWRSGAAWFESQLIDYDVCSNQGNWLYIAGRGADPRQGRRFNTDKQANVYDTDGAYRNRWSGFEQDI